MTIDEKYCIFDAFHPYTDLTWLYLSLSRSTDLKNVYFFPSYFKIQNEKYIDKLILKKIDNYIIQDIKAGRNIENDEYIDLDWFKHCMSKQKSKCIRCFETVELESNNDDLLTIDRINSKIPHLKNNCCIMCLSCNRNKSNKD